MKLLRALALALAVMFAAALPVAAQVYYTALPNAQIQFFDDSGIPLAGGLVYTYAAGTTTPQATYTDSSGGTANANPVVLDSAGRGSVWLSSTNPYKLVVQTSLGTAVWTKDNIADFGATLKRDLATSITSKVINGRRMADGFSGANAGAKIAAAIADIASTGGYVSALGLAGTQAWSSNIFSGITKPITLEIGPGTTTISSNVTIPANVTLLFDQGAILSPNTGLTLTINGPINAPLSKIFAGAGTVTIAPGAADGVRPEWWGALPDGVTDNVVPIQAAIDSVTGNANAYGGAVGPSGGGWSTIRFSPGIYLTKTGVTIAQSGVHLVGAGASSTILRFQPASGPATAVTFSAVGAGSPEMHDWALQDMTIDATGSSLSVVKKALHIYDGAEVALTNLYIRDFSDSTHASQCVEMHGREHIVVENAQWFCNRPLYIGADPETSTESLDRSMFHNVLFGALLSIAEGQTCVADKPVIDISEADAYLTDVTFDGFDFLCGSYSVYWSNTNAKSGPYNVSFRNGRNESVVTNWGFYINPPVGNPLLGLTIDNVRLFGGTKGGWYLRNIPSGNLNSSTFNPAAGVGIIDADSSVGMSLTNMNWNVHSAGNYTALNGWCGVRYNEDSTLSTGNTGDLRLRPCAGVPHVLMEPTPGGPTYSITAASCTANLEAYTIGAHTFDVGAQITVNGVSPSGLNGTFEIVASAGNTVTVVNDQCPATYSSGGTNAMTYGPLNYLSANVVTSDQVQGDLGVRSDGTSILFGFQGTSFAKMNASYFQLYAADGTTASAYIGTRSSVLTDYTLNDLQLRSDGGNIDFGFTGARTVHLPSAGGISMDSATPTVAASQVGFGNSVQAAGSGACPSTVTINGSATAPAGCIVVNIAGTARSIPFF